MSMISRNEISVEILRKLVRYEPETGHLFWLPRAAEHFRSEGSEKTWNRRVAGRRAFSSMMVRGGYGHGTLFNVFYKAHRVAFALHHGEWPKGQIDHIDGDPSNNRAANLRCVSQAENTRNAAAQLRRKTGVSGVTWDADRNRWFAKITVDGHQIALGRYKAISDAIAVRKAAEAKHGFHPNHSRHRRAA